MGGLYRNQLSKKGTLYRKLGEAMVAFCYVNLKLQDESNRLQKYNQNPVDNSITKSSLSNSSLL